MLITLSIIFALGIIYGIIRAFQNSYNSKNPRNPISVLPGSKVITYISIFGFLISTFFAATLFTIGAQEVGVIVTPSGVQEKPIHTGWHIVMPWNEVKIMDKTTWVYSLINSKKEGAKDANDAIWAPTLDGIKMGFDISVNWHIDDEQAPWIYANISGDQDGGGRYHWIEENIIRAAIKSAMPLTISKYTPIQCYSDKRSDIQADVEKMLKKELRKNRIIVEAVQIRDVFYGEAYEKAINNKKLEEQKFLTMKVITDQKEEGLKQATIDKDIAIQKAEGEAKALAIKGTSIAANPKIIQLEWISKWDGSLPTYMMGSGQGVILNMNNTDK
jgi:regulator of protease activity HflC (stomatin/prohibitin superfamily)